MIEETKIQIFSDMIKFIDNFDDAELLMQRFNKELFNRMHGRLVDNDLKDISTTDLRLIRQELQKKHARLKNDKFRSADINKQAHFGAPRGGY